MIETGGVVDKFIGDAIMAYWGAPFVKPEDQDHLACAAALKSIELLELIRENVSQITGIKREVPTIDIRIGISRGPVLVGDVGSETMRNYTVMGDTVNVASRLETVNKEYGTRILVNRAVVDNASDHVLFRQVDMIGVRGKEELVEIYEPMALLKNDCGKSVQLKNDYELALGCYRDGEIERARQTLKKLLASYPLDGSSQRLSRQVESLTGRSI